jgi:AraC-like DNA-binding protein
MFQENNLDIGGRLIWKMSPMQDIYKSATPPFIITESGMFNARPKFYSRREGVDGYLFLYTQSGKGLLKYQGRDYELFPGGGVLIDCTQRHEYKTYDETEGEWVFYWLHFYCEYFAFYSQLIYKNTFSVLDLAGEPLRILDEVLNNLPFSDPESLMVLNDSVNRLLKHMAEVSHAFRPKMGKEETNKAMLKKTVGYIKENYWKPFILEDAANHCGFSKFYFLRLFKEYTGMTPYRFLTIERINIAKQLLLTTDMQILEICVMVGFRDDSNFIRTFKSVTGTTPHLFRLRM